MNRFEDQTTEQIYNTRFAPDVPDHVSVEAHEQMRILAAAHTLQDVSVLGPILRWQSQPDRYGLHVHGKWHVTFVWSNSIGATAIKLERR